jgi:hypothetical protein
MIAFRWALLLLLGTGCEYTPMLVPSDLTNVTNNHPVTDRIEPGSSAAPEGFRVGPYRVSEVTRSAEGADAISHRFRLDDGAGPQALRGECRAAGKREGDTTMDPWAWTLECRCNHAGASEATPSELSVRRKKRRWTGEISAGGQWLAVVPVFVSESGRSTNVVGFAARSPKATLGAFQVEPPGRLWLADHLDPGLRTQLACLFAGALLQPPPT